MLHVFGMFINTHRIHGAAIYANIYHQYTPNVSIYTIHGTYGIYSSQKNNPNRWYFMEHIVCYPVSFPSFEVLDHRNRGLWHAYQGSFSGVLDGSGSSCSKSVAATRQQKEVVSPT